jgi:proliferating cell nuclear antigen
VLLIAIIEKSVCLAALPVLYARGFLAVGKESSGAATYLDMSSMRAELVDCANIGTIFAAVGALCDGEANVTFEAGVGVNIQAMDSAHVALVDMHLSPDYFAELTVQNKNEEEEGKESDEENADVMLCLNISTINKVVSSVGKNDVLVLSSEDGSTAETINFTISNGKNSMKSYDLKTLNCDIDVYNIPQNTEYLATVRMSSALFKQNVVDMSKWGDTCIIEVSNEGISFSSSGDDGNSRFLYRNKNANKDEGEETEAVKQENEENEEDGEGREGGASKQSEEEEEEEEDSPPRKKKQKKMSKKKETTAAKKKKEKATAAAKKKKEKANAAKAPKIDHVDNVEIVVKEPLHIELALNYLTKFTKGANLSNFVVISMHDVVPCRVAYALTETSYVHFHIASKILEDDE